MIYLFIALTAFLWILLSIIMGKPYIKQSYILCGWEKVALALILLIGGPVFGMYDILLELLNILFLPEEIKIAKELEKKSGIKQEYQGILPGEEEYPKTNDQRC